MHFCLFNTLVGRAAFYSKELGIENNGQVFSIGRVLTGGSYLKRYYTMPDVIFFYELRETVRKVVSDAVRKGMPPCITFPPYKPIYSLENKEVKLVAPIFNPSKIWAVRDNYGGSEEVTVSSSEVTSKMFLKPPSSIAGPGDIVVLPAQSTFGRNVQARAGLCAVIGKEARHVNEAQAINHVFGYTICLDIGSADSDAFPSLARGLNTYTPIGPWIVTRDEILNPQNLNVKLWQNDSLKQDGNTKEMVCAVSELVSYLSDISTLYPGDLVFTGTPGGIVTINNGDVIRSQIEKIGELQVSVKSE